MNETSKLKIQSSNQEFIPSYTFIYPENPKETVKIISSDYENKIKNMKSTPDKLMIVSDFDFTMTRNFIGNERLLSCINVMIFSDYISSEFQSISQQLHLKYSKYEYDPSIDINTKDKMMQLWFKENFDLIAKEKISKEDFTKIILQAKEKFYYRYGIIEMFELIEKFQIPFFIVSAGIYEIIESSLKLILPDGKFENLKDKKLINIIANKFKYDQFGYINGYEEPIVYTFNKGEILKKVFKEFGTGDENVILMGDHINDIDSIKFISYKDVIKFGFLNFEEESVDEKKKELVEAYIIKFDVLVFGDGNLNYVNNLIKRINEN